MVKALEHQLGAQEIELDRRDAWAHFDIHQPIDLDHVGLAMRDASYSLKYLDFDVEGHVEKKDGATELVIAPHGQRLPWTGDGPATKTAVRIRLVGPIDGKFPAYELAPKVIESTEPK